MTFSILAQDSGTGAIGGAAAVGALAAWPLAYLISRRVKRKDPNFDHTREGSLIPDPSKPEV